MKVGLRCPAHVTSVAAAVQFALIAQRGGGRFWLTGETGERAILLSAALVGSGFPTPLGIIVTGTMEGEIMRQAAELARLAHQRIIIAGEQQIPAGAERWWTKSASPFSEDPVLSLATMTRVPAARPTHHRGGALTSTAKVRSPALGTENDAAANVMVSADFLFFDIPHPRPLSSGSRPYESGVAEYLHELAVPLGIGTGALDRVDEQEVVLGLPDGVEEVETSRELLALERAVTDACRFIASARAEKARELFKW